MENLRLDIIKELLCRTNTNDDKELNKVLVRAKKIAHFVATGEVEENEPRAGKDAPKSAFSANQEHHEVYLIVASCQDLPQE